MLAEAGLLLTGAADGNHGHLWDSSYVTVPQVLFLLWKWVGFAGKGEEFIVYPDFGKERFLWGKK